MLCIPCEWRLSLILLLFDREEKTRGHWIQKLNQWTEKIPGIWGLSSQPSLGLYPQDYSKSIELMGCFIFQHKLVLLFNNWVWFSLVCLFRLISFHFSLGCWSYFSLTSLASPVCVSSLIPPGVSGFVLYWPELIEASSPAGQAVECVPAGAGLQALWWPGTSRCFSLRLQGHWGH